MNDKEIIEIIDFEEIIKSLNEGTIKESSDVYDDEYNDDDYDDVACCGPWSH